MSKAESTATLQTFSSAVSDLVANAAPSLVAIHSHGSRSSGFAWLPGLIVTADEALADEPDEVNDQATSDERGGLRRFICAR
jgi:hypothetical protein